MCCIIASNSPIEAESNRVFMRRSSKKEEIRITRLRLTEQYNKGDTYKYYKLTKKYLIEVKKF